MKAYTTDKVKNVVLLGHTGSGKTTLAEAMLFEAGAISRRGAVEDQNTVSDYHEIEHKRKNSLFGTLMHVSWKDNKINIIDTPGLDDFVGEVISSLRVADNAVVVLNAQSGVEVGSELIWEYVTEFETPALFVVNHLDSDKADFSMTVEQAKNRFGDAVTVVQYPFNPGNGFNAIIDVLKMTMYEFPEDGGKPEKKPIPASEKAKAEELHNDLVEAVAVNDETLMELYFDQGELTEEQMTKGLKMAMMKQEVFPLFCTSAKQNMGSGRVMGFIRDIAPSAAEMPPADRKSGKRLACDPKGDLCLFVYKTVSEPHLGDMSFFKVFSGTLKTGQELVNAETDTSERFSQIFLVNGKNREQVNQLMAGDLGATVKLKNTHTNDSLHEKGKQLRIAPIEFPPPRITVAITTENKADLEKVAQGLNQLHEEDPTLHLVQSYELREMQLSGQGELHLQIVKWKLKNHYKVAVDFIKPKIPFRETIRKGVETHYRHKKQSGGSGQFGEVHMFIEPYTEGMPNPSNYNVRSTEVVELDWGGKLVFNNCIVGGSIDTKFMAAIMKGIMEKMNDGPLTGSYVRDVRVSVYDGKMHPVDSNDMAFKLASMMAFRQGFQEAKPQLMEPVYDVEVLVAEDAMGDVMSDLQTRRAMIMGIEAEGHYQKIKARVPLMELYKYSSTLRSLSQGRAKHTQVFADYAAVPSEIQGDLIAEYKSATGDA